MIIDGKKIAGEILVELAEEVKTLPKPPKMAAVLVGNIDGSRKFLELKQKAAEKIGVEYQIYEFPEEILTEELVQKITGMAELNGGVIIELPLPVKINTPAVLNAVPENKDPDVLSEKSQQSFFENKSKILPPAVEALKMVFEKSRISIAGKMCAVFGQGFLIGKPISHWLKQNGAVVSVNDEFTKNPENISRKADIVVSGVGKPNLIKPEMVKESAIVIDFGYNNLNGKVMGDVDFGEVSKKVSQITPVPGGMGPVVIAAVLKNLISLVRSNN